MIIKIGDVDRFVIPDKIRKAIASQLVQAVSGKKIKLGFFGLFCGKGYIDLRKKKSWLPDSGKVEGVGHDS